MGLQWKKLTKIAGTTYDDSLAFLYLIRFNFSYHFVPKTIMCNVLEVASIL